MVARAIWFRRNKLIFYGHFQHPDETYRGALKSLEDYRMWKQMEITRQPSMGQNPHIAAWRPPPPGTVKINYDAALDLQQGYVGVGIIARDHMGIFLGARSLVQKFKVQNPSQLLELFCLVRKPVFWMSFLKGTLYRLYRRLIRIPHTFRIPAIS